MVLLNSKMVPLGTEARDFKLKGVDEKEYTLDSFRDKDILIIIIMCNHCPYVKATIGRLVALQHEYEGRGVQLAGINSNDDANYPEDSFENMKGFARDSGMNFPLSERRHAGGREGSTTPYAHQISISTARRGGSSIGEGLTITGRTSRR